jgi:hypothetical protein
MLRIILTVAIVAISALRMHAQDVAALNAANNSVTWEQVIQLYRDLDNKYENAKLIESGLTDCGRPLHLFVMSASGDFDPVKARQQGKCLLLIMNGIHPGEPDGIDASVRMAQELLAGKKKLPSNLLIGIIPVYNIDGSLSRSCCSRANQDGPAEYGFRGNSRNLDLNRDFVKCDSENARSFTSVFRQWDPDVFVDTHVSDGADYSYVMTLISTQHDKLGGEAGKFLKQQMTPALFDMMEKKGEPMAPYVNTKKYDDDPTTGIYAFSETPRFATGYAALYQTMAFVTETHMLKPFPKRVEATMTFLDCIVEYSSANAEAIRQARASSRVALKKAQHIGFNFKADTSEWELFRLKGYEAEVRKSPVTGADQLYYNRQKPYTRDIRFYDHFRATDSVVVPAYYIVPQAWREVTDRLKLNRVSMERLSRDTIVKAECYFIEDYKTVSEPYEGRYLHRDVRVRKDTLMLQFRAGDYLVPVEQDASRYVVEVMEPESEDSFFAWGFFDSILQQKEWFSSYVFDGIAQKILDNDPDLKKRFEEKKQTDASFAGDSFAQLYYIYKSSPYFEKTFRMYPVGRVAKK